MLIAQISDPHILAPGTCFMDRVDTASVVRTSPRSTPSRFGCSSTSLRNSAGTGMMSPSANCMKPRKSAA